MIKQGIKLLPFTFFMFTHIFGSTADQLIEQISNAHDQQDLDALINQLNNELEKTSEEPVGVPQQQQAVTNEQTASEHDLFLQQLEFVKTNKPAQLSLFMKHHSLINSPAFVVIKTTNPCWFPGSRKAFWKKSDTTLTNYLELTHRFFTSKEPTTTLFTYQVAENCLHIELLKNDFSRGIIWMFLLGKPEIAHVLEKILAVMLEIHGQIMESLLPKQPSFMSNILSGEWMMKITRVIEHPNGMFGLDVAHDLLKNKQFKNLQTAGLYALAYTAPSLFTKVLNYFKPSREDARIIEALQLPAHATKDPVRVSDFLITFVDNHPELFEKITTEHPEVLDLLALQLKNLVTPAHKV